MNAPVGRREFFALEAGEYLERLALLAIAPDRPDGEDLVRYARALRGAALMAGPAGYAVAAAAIESVAKAVREGATPWTPQLSEQLSHAVEECKALLRRLREWSDVDLQHCERVAERLEGLIGPAGRRPGVAGAGTGAGLSAGVRAYVAREAAAVAATLEQVAEAVEQRPSSDSADPLLHRLQPLRGLGALPGLSPLPELLEALDLTIAFACRGGAWPRSAGKAFRATASALARMARDIAELGIPQHDSHELVQAAELLREAFAHEDDVVDIAALFFDGDPVGVERTGLPPRVTQTSSGVAMELAGLADRFRHAVAQLGEGRSRTARSLSLNALGLSVRGLALSREVAAAAAGFLERIDRETMSGRALRAGDDFAGILARAVVGLSEAAAAESTAALGGVLAPLSEELDRSAGVSSDRSLEAALEIVPIQSLAPDPESDVIPIESLFYDVVAAAVLSLTPFEQSFATLFRLESAARDITPIVPIESLAPAAEPAAVSIQSLLYRGRRALERADLVRRELDAALKAKRDLTAVEGLLDELLALVPLALDDDH
ncbi:MAG TPA: hypothetical protein VFU23_14580 [Gemmatimonadales bacterium]|nr:hypothetical protein [Gemmatimonadales bacterium]